MKNIIYNRYNLQYELEKFIDGDITGIPLDKEDIQYGYTDFSDDPDFDFSQKMVITDNIYLDIGLDLRWLKRFNPKNHVIF